MPTGYCTVDDLRRALRAADLPGDASQDRQIAIDAITGQTEWLQETTNRHWYEPTGLDEDTDGLVPTDTLTHPKDEQDIPSSAHAGPGQLQAAASRQRRYPQRNNGAYTRVKLARRDVSSVSELLVRGAGGEYTDWVADGTFAQGRGEDYFVQIDGSAGWSHLNLRTSALPVLRQYDNALVATYDYGIEGIPSTVRRAVAMRAAAQLLTDDEAALGIPENASMVSAESKVQAMERQAEELLEVHL